MRLKDKVALVTGGASGIGRATAVLFGREGAKVVVSDIAEPGALDVTEQIRKAGGEATAVAGDVSVVEDAERMVQSAVQVYGRLDVLVNSAGVTEDAGRRSLPEGASAVDVWDRVLDINLKGTYLTCRHAVTEMERTGGGSIINIASINGLVGYPLGMGGSFDPYVPSKGGVLMFTRQLAIHRAAKNIRVNCICPGHIQTPLIKEYLDNPKNYEWLVGHYPIGRFGRPEEIAYPALFLASDESSFMTGAPLVVDGGYTAQ